jgi:UDP-N-acetylglucosamine transferase subunit ALG13
VIFVTVGSMMPFDRLIRAMDMWAGSNPSREVFFQIGRGQYEPRHAPFKRMLPPTEFTDRVENAELIVAHAGMGSVIQAAQADKPIVLFPRRLDLEEHNTDHQLHTTGWLKDRQGIFVAMDDAELALRIEEAGKRQSSGMDIAPAASPELLGRLRSAILGNRAART